ncbi:MAG TPA: hypothetical protein V6D18_18715 [Thermosynechococcaceae cyanobacterium]
MSTRPKKLLYALLLALLGAGYLGIFSLVDVNPVLQNQAALLPVQVGVLIYLLWWRRRKNRLRSPEA